MKNLFIISICFFTFLFLIQPNTSLALENEDEEATIALSTPVDDNSCASDYNDRRKQLLTGSILRPILFTPEVFTGLALGVEAGYLVGPEVIAGSTQWGSIAGSAWGGLIGLAGTSLYFSTKEVLTVVHLIQNHRMMELIKEAHSDSLEPTELRLIAILQKDIAKKGVSVDIKKIKAKVLEFDKNRDLCDGTLTDHQDSHKLKKRLIQFHQFRKIITEFFTN